MYHDLLEPLITVLLESLRLIESLRLVVKYLELQRREITVHQGKEMVTKTISKLQRDLIYNKYRGTWRLLN